MAARPPHQPQQVKVFGQGESSLADPLASKRDHFGEQRLGRASVEGQGIIDKEPALAIDGGDLVEDPADGPRDRRGP
jgi:hypothetical protein